ncbi:MULTISPECIES: YkyA family protein [Bacillaceae]|uniref:YkyA family protein n=1 Tax=Bacillaceae TaxID=186817 RepID=UPI00280BE368|nr:YkyA family protein [Rossellomorea sp. YZS02]MDX8342933.1 YkyA family protein [Rossellomorea sp. YZS02]
MSKFRFAFILGAAIFLLMGCVGGSTPEEDLYKVLEETVAKESQYVDVQKPLQESEKKEKELYSKIMDLGMKEFDQIVKLSDEALENIDRRKEYIEKERKSMNQAKDEFARAEEYMTELDSEELKKEAKKLNETMKERYQIHDELTSSYLEALSLDKELYNMFKKKDLKMEELEKQITSINEQYEKIVEFNKDYNTKTDEFNKLKQDFYSKAELDVKEPE